MDKDFSRQIWVTVAAALCIIGTLLGFGIIGTPVEDSSSGAFSADATLLAPAGTAFSIWSVIYIGLLAYVIWQWLPSNRASELARATGVLAGISMVLNAAWILVTQWGWVWVSVVVIFALAIVLGLLVALLQGIGHRSIAERIVVDGTFGLYLGWVTIASVANVAAATVSSGIEAGELASQWIAAATLVAAALLGLYFFKRLGGRFAVAIALAWGIAWIAVGRLSDTPYSIVVGVTAILAALVVISGVFWFRQRETSPAPAVL